MACPGTQMFEQLVAGQLAPDLRAQLADHAASCPTCHQLVTALVTRAGVAAPQPVQLAVGDVLDGRYRIDRLLGAGGMGIVVAATHVELGNPVAIKLMRDELLAHPSIVERFLREARAVSRLRTEHVCRVIDVARLPTGAPYIVMELLDGTDLSRVVSRKPLAQATAVDHVLEACVALREAHALGIIHRDLKPANLFLTRSSVVKVLDFGIAKVFEGDASLTRTRVLMGSPGYMSPEQLESARDVDVRTDIWALGVTLYELLAARMPFPAKTQAEIAIKVMSEPPVPLDVDPRLRAIVFRCLEKPRERRYPDVATLAADLAAFGSRGVSAAPTPVRPPPTVDLPPRRSRAWLAALVGVAVVGAAVAIPLALRGGGAPAPADARLAMATVADAAIDAAPDAAPDASIDAAIDAPIDAPPDAAPAKEVPFEQQLHAGMAAAADACRKMLAAKVPTFPMAILECACMVGDRARAQQAFAALPTSKLKTDMQRMCAHFGVKL